MHVPCPFRTLAIIALHNFSVTVNREHKRVTTDQLFLDQKFLMDIKIYSDLTFTFYTFSKLISLKSLSFRQGFLHYQHKKWNSPIFFTIRDELKSILILLGGKFTSLYIFFFFNNACLILTFLYSGYFKKFNMTKAKLVET